MECAKILKKLSAYVDGELSSTQIQFVENHIKKCDNCRKIFISFKKTVSLYHSLKTYKMPQYLHKELITAIRKEWEIQKINVKIGKETYPAVDIMEKESKFIINIELPGIEKEDIKLLATHNFLELITYKQKIDAFYYINEISYGEIYRKIFLPKRIKIDKISAELKDGILSITIQK